MSSSASDPPTAMIPPVDPAGAALRGAHRDLAVGGEGAAIRYRPEISPFASVGVDAGEDAWRALGELPGDICAIFAETRPALTPGWQVLRELSLPQMAGPPSPPSPPSPQTDPADPDPDVVPLGRADIPAMLDLTARTQPGPFLAETIAFGGYVGVRRDGVLAAMAGRRLRPDGWIEISAVCTDPAYRGAGLARRVTGAVMAGIHADGARPFLHVLADNPARRLYEAMGFTVARQTLIVVLQRG